MSRKEVSRLEIIQKVINEQLTQKQAAKILGVTARQIRRLIKKFKVGGVGALVSKHRGKSSNHRYPQKFKDNVLSIIKEQYSDFGPTLASEKLRLSGNCA